MCISGPTQKPKPSPLLNRLIKNPTQMKPHPESNKNQCLYLTLTSGTWPFLFHFQGIPFSRRYFWVNSVPEPLHLNEDRFILVFPNCFWLGANKGVFWFFPKTPPKATKVCAIRNNWWLLTGHTSHIGFFVYTVTRVINMDSALPMTFVTVAQSKDERYQMVF